MRNGWVQGPARKRRTLEVSRQSPSKSAFAPAHKEDRRFQTRLKPSRAAGFVVTRDLARWEPGAWGLAAYPTQRPGRSRTLGVRPGSLLQVSLRHRSVSGAANLFSKKEGWSKDGSSQCLARASSTSTRTRRSLVTRGPRYGSSRVTTVHRSRFRSSVSKRSRSRGSVKPACNSTSLPMQVGRGFE